MAKLGTKQRPAIVRVRTEARAQEVAALFAEHGWQFILGIEPGKPENIADLTRLLKTKKSGHQIASDKAKKPASRRTSNAPLRGIQTRKEHTQSSTTDMKVDGEACEYIPNMDKVKRHIIVSCALSVFFLVQFVSTTSLWYVVLLILPLLYFLSLINALVLNQKVALHGTKITILRRRKTPITANVADSLYQIVVIKGAMFSFRFRFHNRRKVTQITPSVYKNGNRFLRQLTAIIDQENIVVDIIEK